MSGKTRRDMIMNDTIRESLGSTNSDKDGKKYTQWFGHHLE